MLYQYSQFTLLCGQPSNPTAPVKPLAAQTETKTERKKKFLLFFKLKLLLFFYVKQYGGC